LNWFDPFGLRPGDIFVTLDEAGRDAANYAQCRSRQAADEFGFIEGRGPEYGGYIAQNEDGTFTYDEPVTDGRPDRVNLGAPPPNAAGDYHSHTNDLGTFSGTDKRGSARAGTVGYLGTADGAVVRFTPRGYSDPEAESPYGDVSTIQDPGGAACTCE
jgi:hypothetical protein